MAKSTKRPLAVFQTAKYIKIGDFILKSKAIVQDITNNATYFPTPSPTLASVTADITKLENLQTVALTRVPGATGARDQQYVLVLKDIRNLMAYVQQQADAAGSVIAAATIIQAAGFVVKGTGDRTKAPLSAKYDTKTGVVKLLAKATKRASYNWQYSVDLGTTWVDMPQTMQAKTSIAGLTPSDKLAFRMRAVTKDGVMVWGDAVTLFKNPA